MLNNKKIISGLFTFILAVTLLFGETMGAIPSDFSKFNVLSYRSDAAGRELLCPVKGEIIKEQKSGDKTTILLSCTHTYYWQGKEETCNYELIIYNIKNYINDKNVKKTNSRYLESSVSNQKYKSTYNYRELSESVKVVSSIVLNFFSFAFGNSLFKPKYSTGYGYLFFLPLISNFKRFAVGIYRVFTFIESNSSPGFSST